MTCSNGINCLNEEESLNNNKAMMEYLDSGSRNWPSFITDLHSKWTDAYKKDEYPNYQRKDHIDPKRPPQRNRPKQQQTYNVPTNDVVNTKGTNKRRDLFLAKKPWIFSWGTERIPQKIQRYRKITLHWSAYPKREQDQTEKSIYGLDWLQKGI